MVSVIVCTYNRAKYLPNCLKHLANQNTSFSKYEVLIIDNNSTDNTADICTKLMADKRFVNFRYFLEPNQGLSFARNRGVKEAEGDILSFIDDDAFAHSDFVKNTQSYFDQHHEVSAIGGKIIPVYETEQPKWMSKYLLTLVAALDMGGSPRKFKGSKFPIGANMAFKKEVFNKFGLFNTKLGRSAGNLEGGEEKDLFLRLKKQNELINYVPSVCVNHIIPDKRLNMKYIKGLGVGVGSSEIKRLKGAGLGQWINKLISELIKIAGTFVLFFLYLLKGRFSAAAMLVKFRFWVFKGMVLNRKV